jgi:hypothetical protein
MRKIGLRILIAGTIVWSLVKALWLLLNGIGNYEEAQRLFENRGSLLKALVQTSSFWPLAFLGLGLFLLAYIQFGSPRNWIRTSEEKKQEQEVYDKTISDYAKQGEFAINAFYKSGGFKLSARSIRVLLKRLAQIKIEVLPDEIIAPSEQAKFINRLNETGRALETPEEANDAWVEWRESKTLRAPWE